MGTKRGKGKETGNGGQEPGWEEKQPICSRTERKDEQKIGLYLGIRKGDPLSPGLAPLPRLCRLCLHITMCAVLWPWATSGWTGS